MGGTSRRSFASLAAFLLFGFGVSLVGWTNLSELLNVAAGAKSPEQTEKVEFVPCSRELVQRFSIEKGVVTLRGQVPSNELSVAIVDSLGRDNVVDEFRIDDDAVFDSCIRVSSDDLIQYGIGRTTVAENQFGPSLDAIHQLLEDYSDSILKVVVHSRSGNSNAWDMQKSTEMAAATKQFLVNLGTEPTRISIEGRDRTRLLQLEGEDSWLTRTEFLIHGIVD